MVAELHKLYADGKHAEILARWIPAQRRGWQLHRRARDVPTSWTFLAERMLAEANGGQGLPGLAGELPGGQGGGSHAQDQSCRATTNMIIQAFWQ